jgi:hypothetical protein
MMQTTPALQQVVRFPLVVEHCCFSAARIGLTVDAAMMRIRPRATAGRLSV